MGKSAPNTTEETAAVVPSAPVATHPDPRIQVAAGNDEHGILQRGRLALIPAGGQEWRHWQGSGHSPACQEVKKTFEYSEKKKNIQKKKAFNHNIYLLICF